MTNLTKIRKQDISDKLFIQEIINDLHRNGVTEIKAYYMLKDWSRELKEKSGLRGKTKNTYIKLCGKAMW